jgi:hypothetical protein
MSRKPHTPTDEQRKTVKAMVGYGIVQDDIATVIGIDPKTLRLHYATEIAKGAIEANAQVAQSLFKAAKGGNMTAAIWWTKTRMGWKETVRVGGEGENGAIIFQVLTGVPRPDMAED